MKLRVNGEDHEVDVFGEPCGLILGGGDAAHDDVAQACWQECFKFFGTQ